MTDLIRDLQKQAPDGGLVSLYELEMPSGSTLYFHAGIHANTANVTFDGHTYQALPAEVTGIEISSDGASTRPTLSIANILSVFRDALGASYTFNDLLGKKFTRRRTLTTYLTSSPAVEYPKDIYYIDRISNKTIVSVIFDLASPFDLEGVKLPARTVIGGGCSWRYQGASPDLSESVKDGGCMWNRFSQVIVAGVTYTNFINVNDEPVVINTSAVAWPGSATIGNVYSTSQGNLVRINNDGTFTYNVSSSNYWQCMSTTGNTPTDTDPAWRRCRVYSTYSNTLTYTVFTDPNYNSHVIAIYDGGPRLFKKRYVTQTNAAQGADPGYNEHWELADSCGKRLFSCTRRFQYKVGGSNGQTVPSTTYDQTVILPFGGFPGSRTYT
jgi:lambda family phage minor tail protein L